MRLLQQHPRHSSAWLLPVHIWDRPFVTEALSLCYCSGVWASLLRTACNDDLSVGSHLAGSTQHAVGVLNIPMPEQQVDAVCMRLW